MSPNYLLSSYRNFESEPSLAQEGTESWKSQSQDKAIGNNLKSKTLTRRCQDDKLSSATAIQGLPSASFHYRHQIEWRQQEAGAYSTMFLFCLQEWLHQRNKKKYAWKSTRVWWLSTYPEILGRVACLEQSWKNQRLVKVVEYFAASF